MASILPKTVKWNSFKHHHLSVFIWPDARCFISFCAECNQEVVRPLDALKEFKEALETCGDTQVMCWIETNG